jgi:hypothetical protein
MKVLITKASDDYWYSFANFETFNDIISFKENVDCGLEIVENFWYKEDVEEIFNSWAQEDKNFTMKDAYSISECRYEILIEDSEY